MSSIGCLHFILSVLLVFMLLVLARGEIDNLKRTKIITEEFLRNKTSHYSEIQLSPYETRKATIYLPDQLPVKKAIVKLIRFNVPKGYQLTLHHSEYLQGSLKIIDGCLDDEQYIVENLLQSYISKEDIGFLWGSVSRCVWVLYQSRNYNWNYFTISYKLRKESCGGILTKPSGNITSPSYPRKYPNQAECKWFIIAPRGKVIKVKFFDFQVEMSETVDNCQRDYFTVRDGWRRSPKLEKYCGYTRPLPFISSSHHIQLEFISDNLFQEKGFYLEYTQISSKELQSDYPSDCGGLLTNSSGSFSSPNYPEQYPHNLECIWTIELEPLQNIELTFRSFDVQESMPCLDYVMVQDGATSWAEQIGQYCGQIEDVPHVIKSKENKLRITLKTNRKYAGSGFLAFYKPYSTQQATQGSSFSEQFNGIIIGSACGTVFIIISILAIRHTRLRQAQSANGSNHSGSLLDNDPDIHQAAAPPSYDTVMASPDLYPPTPQSSLRRAEMRSVSLSDDSDCEDPPPYPGVVGVGYLSLEPISENEVFVTPDEVRRVLGKRQRCISGGSIETTFSPDGLCEIMFIEDGSDLESLPNSPQNERRLLRYGRRPRRKLMTTTVTDV